MKLSPNKCIDNEAFDGVAVGDISGSTFYSCEFTSLNMTSAVVGNTTFENCSFSGSDLSGLKVSGASFLNVDFVDCRMLGIDWSRVAPLVFSINITGSNCSFSIFDGLSLTACGFTNLNLTDCSFDGCDLAAMCIDDCDLSGASFKRARMHRTDLSSSYNVVLDHKKSILGETKLSVGDGLSILRRQGIVV